jgi:hypothetical protein
MRFRYFPFFILILLISIPNNLSALNLVINQDDTVKFSEVENAPFYIDWCTSNISKDKIRECTDSGIKLFAKKNFKSQLAVNLKLSGYQRITSSFIIDKSGKIVNIAKLYIASRNKPSMLLAYFSCFFKLLISRLVH